MSHLFYLVSCAPVPFICLPTSLSFFTHFHIFLPLFLASLLIPLPSTHVLLHLPCLYPIPTFLNPSMILHLLSPRHISYLLRLLPIPSLSSAIHFAVVLHHPPFLSSPLSYPIPNSHSEAAHYVLAITPLSVSLFVLFYSPIINLFFLTPSP